MRKPKPLDAAHLSRFFIYDESSPSCLRWNRAVSNKVKAGFIAGYKLDSGYWKVSLDGEIYYVHRIIALLHGMFNSVTSDAVDHINGNPSDNRVLNIRAVSESLNRRNSRKKIKSQGQCGVTYDQKSTKGHLYAVAQWYEMDGKRKTKSFSHTKYGREKAISLAVYARNLAMDRLISCGAGYTNRHGE